MGARWGLFPLGVGSNCRASSTVDYASVGVTLLRVHRSGTARCQVAMVRSPLRRRSMCSAVEPRPTLARTAVLA